MQVTILHAPQDPWGIINEAAAVCYAKDPATEDEAHKYKRVRNCFKMGHLSVFEHVNVTFKIEGISRNCCTQLFRHRHMSVNQESQRYVKYDGTASGKYVMPDNVTKAQAAEMAHIYGDAFESYQKLVEHGMKPEDARNVLPGGFKASCIVTTNLRELFSIFDQRISKAAQKEIRDLVQEMQDQLAAVNDDYASIIEMYNEAHAKKKLDDVQQKCEVQRLDITQDEAAEAYLVLCSVMGKICSGTNQSIVSGSDQASIYKLAKKIYKFAFNSGDSQNEAHHGA